MGPNLIALAIPLFFAAIGGEMWLGCRRGRRLYRTGDTVANLGCGVAQQLMSFLVATAVGATAYQWVSTHALWRIPTTWLPWVVAVFGVEFAYYWWHRLSHEVNVLWAAHVVHHQSEEYNLAVALRQSVSTWLTGLPFYLPLALLGVPFFHFSVVLGLSTLYQFWIHTELVPSLGRVERFLNTPSLHRVHHAINPKYLDKNHAATFSFFDVLFGTWRPESERCVYGTSRRLNSYNPLWAQIETYVELFKLARRAPTWSEAGKVFFASPAWHPAWASVTPMKDEVQKYDPQVEPGVLRYVQVNWGVLMLFVVWFLLWGSSLALWPKVASVTFIVWSLLSLPAMTERCTWARLAELGRIVVSVATVAAVLIAEQVAVAP